MLQRVKFFPTDFYMNLICKRNLGGWFGNCQNIYVDGKMFKKNPTKHFNRTENDENTLNKTNINK